MPRTASIERAEPAGGPGGGAPSDIGARAAGTASTLDAASTRSRILDVALDLFVDKGFDRTSLREIAERLGITKAAIYYHFSSKDDILLALHMRLHEVGKDALKRLSDERPLSVTVWATLLDEVMGQMLAQRQLFLLHERNQAAFEKLHRQDHDADHEDLQEAFQRVLADPEVALRDRIRMACSFGAVFASLFLVGDAFTSVPDEELGEELRGAVHDVLRA